MSTRTADASTCSFRRHDNLASPGVIACVPRTKGHVGLGRKKGVWTRIQRESSFMGLPPSWRP